MSGLEDEDGIDGPFDRAMKRSMRDDMTVPRIGVEEATKDVFKRGRWVAEATITARSGRALIAASREAGNLGRTSRVNRSITHGMGLDILERGIASYEPTAALHPLVAKNILKETR